MGHGEKKRLVRLKHIYDALGPLRASANLGFHSLTGCDSTGHIKGKSKGGCFGTFLQMNDDVLQGLAQLGESEDLTDEVYVRCEEYLCQLYSSKKKDLHISQRFEMERV